MRDRTAGNAAAGKESEKHLESALKNTSAMHITVVEGAEPTGERAGPAGRAGRAIGGATAPES